jgi:hypothetical protein
MKRTKVIVPIPRDDAGVAARAEQLPADFARAGFQPEFVAELTNAGDRVILLNNTNFWRIRERKFQEVYVYMSGANVHV